jgi:hypothetical protein
MNLLKMASGGAVAGLIGAAIWAAIGYFSGLEIGWIAWGIGMLVGALTVGSASPHLLNAFGGVSDWQPVMYLAAASALAGGLIGLWFIDEGPFRMPSPRFNIRYVGTIFRNRDLMLANLGYLGHMWELYAMWLDPAFLLASFAISGLDRSWVAWSPSP